LEIIADDEGGIDTNQDAKIAGERQMESVLMRTSAEGQSSSWAEVPIMILN
jgi:hypothetical protein